MGESLRKVLAVYTDRRVLTILFLGFSSGLPLALTGSTLTRWLSEGAVDRATIGLFALVSLPYTLKFFWAPLVDRLTLPVIGRRFGQRRSWALFTQVLLALAIFGLGTTDPTLDLWWTAFLSVVVAFCSASQDIVVDAYRVEYLRDEQQAAGAAIYVLGYRFGMLLSGAGALYIATDFGWHVAYAAMAIAVAIGFITVLVSGEPVSVPPADAVERQRRVERWLSARPHLKGWRADLLAWLHGAVVAPFAQFTKRDAWVIALLFIAFYKAGEVIAGQMSQPFYFELGFEKNEVANVSKIFGLWATIVGGLIGGVMVERIGVMRGLLVGGVMQMVSNLGYVVLAYFGHDWVALAGTVAVENVCMGIATSAFVAYLSSLCNASYSATQYALLSSFDRIGGNLAGAASGFCAVKLGWIGFFLFSMVVALPALGLLLWMMGRQPRMGVPAPEIGTV